MTTDEYIRCISKGGESLCGASGCTGDLDSVHQAYIELQPKEMSSERREHALRFRVKRRRVDHARISSRCQTGVDFSDLPDSRNSSQEIEIEEVESAVRESLNVLTPKQRQVVNVIHFQQRTQKYAAEALGCSPQAINKCYHAALDRLNKIEKLRSCFLVD